jgi:hypothetical protein
MLTSSRALPGLPGDVASLLFEFLRQMDAEATRKVGSSGAPAGLWDYGRHSRPELKKPQCELEWCKRLAQLLTEREIPVRLERDYPDQEQRPRRGRKRQCDLVVTMSGGQSLWIEVKGAWRDWWGGKNKTYLSWLLHPLVPGLDKSKSHTVPLDLKRLSTLRPPDADHVAELLIGFERPDDPIDSDIATLVSLAGLGAWNVVSCSWMSPTTPGRQVRCWFWHKPADAGWKLPVVVC